MKQTGKKNTEVQKRQRRYGYTHLTECKEKQKLRRENGQRCKRKSKNILGN